MSAFLMFAQQRRRPLQKDNPDMSNADISRLLGEVWRNASVVEKRPFLEREEVERKIYKAKMEAWKNDQKLQKSLKKSASLDQTGHDDQHGHDDQQRQDTTPSTREDSYSRFGTWCISCEIVSSLTFFEMKSHLLLSCLLCTWNRFRSTHDVSYDEGREESIRDWSAVL